MYSFLPYRHEVLSPEDMLKQSQLFYKKMEARRSIREFSDLPVSKEIIENILLAAGSAPSGANKQPWTFCAVCSTELKKKIREAAEKEEYENYHGRMSERWLQDLAPLATDWHKPFLEFAPWLIVIFKKVYEISDTEEHLNNYYVNESVGIATGFLITAIHQAGLVTLTHTPSPMNFLTKVLERPENERPFLLLPVGYASPEAQVPDIRRKSLKEISVWYE